MSNVVYLIGHGRVSNKEPVEVPEHMTMHWLGELGDVSNGISYAFLAGELTAELNTSAPRENIRSIFCVVSKAISMMWLTQRSRLSSTGKLHTLSGVPILTSSMSEEKQMYRSRRSFNF